MKSDPLITYRRKPATLDSRRLQSFAEVLRDRVARGREFHCRITNDAEMRSLNKQFRAKDYATDVLSFPSSAVGENGRSLGDIAVSIQRARAQAREWRHSVDDEIRILMLHGVLHLLGMDHELDSGRMRRTEIRWRKKLGLPVGLIERVAEGEPR
ncbi:MAG TPA: rRNA maturation RNase YbeY [Bryobacteraceae bacterium]|jgi:probable rRNA maturation factor|nr:rRNA maturation RNase YbeY [Bryobacteraceae bacterium]